MTKQTNSHPQPLADTIVFSCISQSISHSTSIVCYFHVHEEVLNPYEQTRALPTFGFSQYLPLFFLRMGIRKYLLDHNLLFTHLSFLWHGELTHVAVVEWQLNIAGGAVGCSCGSISRLYTQSLQVSTLITPSCALRVHAIHATLHITKGIIFPLFRSFEYP